MCGIFCLFSKNTIQENDYSTANEIRLRGPDNTITEYITENVLFCFHRLMINDLTSKGNQPLSYNGVHLICNGEIYNSDELKKEFDIQFQSNSDCEVLLHVYLKYGFKEMCQKIDGVFAIVLYDEQEQKLYIGRDPFGVRPMFIGFNEEKEQIQIASEFKGIDESFYAKQFQPGSFACFELSLFTDLLKTQKPFKENKDYFEKYYFIENNLPLLPPNYDLCKEKVRNSFTNAVKKRLMSDRPIGCLLSGGLDSSLVCAIVAEEFKKQNKGELNTFSIGFEGSTDLINARKVADHINSKHHEILLTTDEFLQAIPEVIKTIESYDTTTVRASVGNYLVSKYIKENTDITVVFNGDGSDEVAGGYAYFKKAPNDNEFDKECIRLLKDISFFDVLRSDRSLSSKWSLESRTPFLDKEFVATYLSCPVQFRRSSAETIEKKLLRDSFGDLNLLPDEILWRKKEAFSDGVSGTDNSWHNIIKKHVDEIITDRDFEKSTLKIIHNKPVLKESYYYRFLFHLYYRNSFIIPYFWMPKWSKTLDPSARELD